MSSTPRRILRIIEPQAVVEGAGVRLKRSIGTRTLDYSIRFCCSIISSRRRPPTTRRAFRCIRIAASKP